MLDGWKRALPAAAAVPLVILAGGRELLGQAAGEEAPEFDVERAYLADETIFVPFLVEETEPLAEALREGVVEEETSLLVMEHSAGRLALVTDQMAYHHVAQGDIAGEPWMVSF